MPCPLFGPEPAFGHATGAQKGGNGPRLTKGLNHVPENPSLRSVGEWRQFAAAKARLTVVISNKHKGISGLVLWAKV